MFTGVRHFGTVPARPPALDCARDPLQSDGVGTPTSRRILVPVIAAALAFLWTLCAAADEITEPQHGVSVLYDSARWSAAIEDRDLDFKCKAAECGGDDAECTTSMTPTKPGVTVRDLFDEFERLYSDSVVDGFTENGWDAVLIDQPSTYLVGSSMAAISSVRYEQEEQAKRAWFVEFGAPFGVLVLACYGREDRYETASQLWRKLAEAFTFPKEWPGGQQPARWVDAYRKKSPAVMDPSVVCARRICMSAASVPPVFTSTITSLPGTSLMRTWPAPVKW
jgi:hypothetical protein